ncbi:MAG: sialidase family protein [Boseongicola sp.]|nr:sialidase family protein [Boseongicola sp.]
MIEAQDAHHSVVYRDEHAYCAHPHVAASSGGAWMIVFNVAPRRKHVLHPPEEPLFRNVMIRSGDHGAHWTAPQVVPSYEFSGAECAGLTPLSDGGVLLSQWRFRWFPLDLALARPDQSGLTYPEVFMRGRADSPEHDADGLALASPREAAPWVRGPGETWVHRSDGNGASFGQSVRMDSAQFSGGYAMRSGVELADGTVLLLLSDVPNYRRVFSVRSSDGGCTWSTPSLVAAGDGHAFEEPAVAISASGRLVAVLRDNETRHLHRVVSIDGGHTWSPPRRLSIEGYPAHLLAMRDGRLLLTFGWRKADFGIRAALSSDDGENWGVGDTIRIRGRLRNRNLGYPSTISADDHEFFTVYYAEDHSGCTCIMATRWKAE